MLPSGIRTLAAAAAIAIVGLPAYAISVTPFATPLSVGDSTLGNAAATADESFGATTLSFTAAEDLTANISATINPFLADLSGNPTNSITIDWSINGGFVTRLDIVTVSIPTGSIGAAGLGVGLEAGDEFQFLIGGVAGQSGNQVTFAIETTAPAPVPVPAAGLLGLSGIAALVGMRRRRKHS